MAVPTYTWVSLWFLISAPIVLWDASYCFFRPRSFRGGDLHWIWEPYSLYQDIDLIYGTKVWERGDGFTNAQSALNLVETFLNLLYIYIAHVAKSDVAPLVGFAAVVMTLSKTVLYMAQDYFCHWCTSGHNDFKTIVIFYVIPNGMWILFPSLIILRLGKDIATSLHIAGTPPASKVKAE